MIVLAARRIASALASVALALALGFAVLHLAPGHALGASAEQAGRSVAARAALQARLGLDAPLSTQFVGYLAKVVRADFGLSLADQQPVMATVAGALANSVLLCGSALLVATLLGMAVGVLEGWRPNSPIGKLLGGLLTVLYALPEFVIAIVLVVLLSFCVGAFPVGGMHDPVTALVGSPTERLIDRAWHLVLPALSLALGWAAAIARQQRVALSGIAAEDFVRTARAKGVAPARVLFAHAMPHALTGVLATVGVMLPVIVGGAVVVETVFGWPGMGTLAVRAIVQRDYPVVSASIIATALVVSVGAVVTEIAAGALDPRRVVR